MVKSNVDWTYLNIYFSFLQTFSSINLNHRWTNFKDFTVKWTLLRKSPSDRIATSLSLSRNLSQQKQANHLKRKINEIIAEILKFVYGDLLKIYHSNKSKPCMEDRSFPFYAVELISIKCHFTLVSSDNELIDFPSTGFFHRKLQ